MNHARFGFTLVEVNLAIFIMAVGVLSMCALYSLGYRESSQSIEDVNAAAYADACLAPLVAALSSTQIKWDDWVQIGEKPSGKADNYGVDGRWPAGGWGDYVTTKQENRATTYKVISNPASKARSVYGQVASCVSASGVSVGSLELPKGYQAGLVVSRRGAVVQLAFRLSRRTQSLMSQSVFVAEVHYQGGFRQ